MKDFHTYILITSLFLNVFFAFRTSDYYKPSNVKVVKVSHQKEELDKTKATGVSDDTTSFVLDFISKIDQCDTFLWSVSENNREIKYTIWFSK